MSHTICAHSRRFSLSPVVTGDDLSTAQNLLESWKATANATVAAASATTPAADTALTATMVTLTSQSTTHVTTTTATPQTSVTTVPTAAASPVSPISSPPAAPVAPSPATPKASTSVPPVSASPTLDADSALRKRKAAGASAPGAAASRSGLAQSVLAGIEYPVASRTPASLRPPLPGADAFFAKPTPPPVPAAAAAASSRPIATRTISVGPGAGTTGGDLRSKIRRQFCCSLEPAAVRSAGDPDETFSHAVLAVAGEIEHELMTISKRDTGAAYRNKAREVAMNLRDAQNPELRERVLSGAISARDLLTLPFTELASSALKNEREAALKWEMQERRTDLQTHVTVTDAWRCGKCRERKCSYYQMQTRSADEPMTTFVRCLNCGNRWRC